MGASVSAGMQLLACKCRELLPSGVAGVGMSVVSAGCRWWGAGMQVRVWAWVWVKMCRSGRAGVGAGTGGCGCKGGECEVACASSACPFVNCKI